MNADRLNKKDDLNHYRAMSQGEARKIQQQVQVKEKETSKIEEKIKQQMMQVAKEAAIAQQKIQQASISETEKAPHEESSIASNQPNSVEIEQVSVLDEMKNINKLTKTYLQDLLS